MAVSQTIATIPQAPSRADPANFVTRHEAVLDRLETLPPEMNTWKDQVNTTQSAINASELQAGQSATAATNAASLVLSYSNAEQYAAGTTYAPGETTIGSNGTAYRRLNTSAAGDNPVTSTTGNWTPAITALGAMSTFDLICRIAGMQPTLYLNAKEQDYRIYSPATGLTRKALADIVTTERAGDAGAIYTPQGKLVQLAENTPRVTFDPETGVGEGLLVEEARANLLTYSEEFDNADWVKTNATVTNEKLARSLAEASKPFVAQFFTQASSTTYTASVEAEAAECPYLVLMVTSGGVFSHYSYAYFNLTTGEIGISGYFGEAGEPYPTIKPLGNGRFRCSINYIAPSTVPTGGRVSLMPAYSEHSGNPGNATFAGTIGDGIYIRRPQIEAGSSPTSYIPTTTAAATRTADVIKIDGTAFSDFYRQDQGSILSWSRPNYNDGILQGVFGITNGTSHPISLRAPNTGIDGYRSVIGGIFSGATSGPVVNTSSPTAIALAWDGVNGRMQWETAGEDVIGTPVLDMNEIQLGRVFDVGWINGNIPALVYFPRRLPNATLQQLSALVI